MFFFFNIDNMALTNKVVAKRLNISLTKVRRLTKDFLPPDPVATMQSGKTRRFNYFDAFAIYLGHHLITEMKFKIKEAKVILKDIHPWLRKRALDPDIKEDDAGIEVKESGNSIAVSMEGVIHIMNANTESGFFYRVLSDIETQIIRKRRKQYTRMEFKEEIIIEPPKGRKLLIDELNIRILDMNKLFADFNSKIGE